jgi:hypothetical protein
MINFLPVLSRITLLLLSIIVLVDRFVPRVRISVDDLLVYAGIGFYLMLVMIELAMNTRDAHASKDTTALSFKYLTRGVIFRKVLLFVILIAMSVIALVALNDKVLQALAVSVTAIELLAFIARATGGLYRVVIGKETLAIIEDQRKEVHYSRIKDVEFRYDIFFFRMNDSGVYEVHVPSISESHQRMFAFSMNKWLEDHSIPITEEGKKNLEVFL